MSSISMVRSDIMQGNASFCCTSIGKYEISEWSTDFCFHILTGHSTVTVTRWKADHHRIILGHPRDGCDNNLAVKGANQVKAGFHPGFPSHCCATVPAPPAAPKPCPVSFGPWIAVPKVYYGEPETLKVFLTIVSLYFSQNPTSDWETLTSHLGGKAPKWAAAMCEGGG